MSLKLENWGDLFKFNKELLDDDYNRDQSLVVKAKTRSLDGLSVITTFNFYQISMSFQELGTTYKQGVPDKNNECKVQLETKFKAVYSGTSHEGTIKQDGSYNFEIKSDILAVNIL